jgi:hypothetical protein
VHQLAYDLDGFQTIVQPDRDATTTLHAYIALAAPRVTGRAFP